MIEYKIDDNVEFDDGRGNRLTGTVTRANWGRHGRYISIRTDGDNQLFVRDVTGSVRKVLSE